jgi:hypothetical protein
VNLTASDVAPTKFNIDDSGIIALPTPRGQAPCLVPGSR